MSQPILTLPSDQDASGRTLGEEEIEAVTEVLRSGTLTSTKGPFVKRLEQDFADRLGVRYAFACSSGTAAIHTAVAAIDPEPGDEIITTSITDMGALTPILYQGAIPVFADVDPLTCNVTAETIEARISAAHQGDHRHAPVRQSRATWPAIMELARERGIPVIEDCAQAFLARTTAASSSARSARIGCFSLQQGKHITTGEGGLVVTERPGPRAADASCSSTRPGATATRSRTTTSSRSTTA